MFAAQSAADLIALAITTVGAVMVASLPAYFVYRQSVKPKLEGISVAVNGRLDAALKALEQHRELLRANDIEPPAVPPVVDPEIMPMKDTAA